MYKQLFSSVCGTCEDDSRTTRSEANISRVQYYVHSEANDRHAISPILSTVGNSTQTLSTKFIVVQVL